MKTYESGGFMIQEHPQLDGDGDGKATPRPAKNDADGATTTGLVHRKKGDFG